MKLLLQRKPWEASFNRWSEKAKVYEDYDEGAYLS